LVQLSSTVPIQLYLKYRSPTTPTLPKQLRFGLFPVRSPLLRESLLFSFPPGTKMFQFSGFAFLAEYLSCNRWVAPFGYLRIISYLHLPVAFRSLSRPSSPLGAKASSIRSYSLFYFLVFCLYALDSFFCQSQYVKDHYRKILYNIVKSK
jgi:hypothetical protein